MAFAIDHHEPLVRRAEDHRAAATPAVRIGMNDLASCEDAAASLEPADDVGVNFEHAPAHERLGSGKEAPRRVHRARYREPGTAADLEVLAPAPRSHVDQAGAVLEAHVRGAGDDRGLVVAVTLE